jgi:hypothetical protein
MLLGWHVLLVFNGRLPRGALCGQSLFKEMLFLFDQRYCHSSCNSSGAEKLLGPFCLQDAFYPSYALHFLRVSSVGVWAPKRTEPPEYGIRGHGRRMAKRKANKMQNGANEDGDLRRVSPPTSWCQLGFWGAWQSRDEIIFARAKT